MTGIAYGADLARSAFPASPWPPRTDRWARFLQKTTADRALPLARRKGLRVEPPLGRSARILVVDDDPSSAQALAALLREEGHEAAVASSGAAAMTTMGSGACALLLLDPSLRDHTGLRVLSYADELGVPKIVMTSDPAFDPERTHYTKVSGFLYKPIRLPTLLGLITNALNPGDGPSGAATVRPDPRSATSD